MYICDNFIDFRKYGQTKGDVVGWFNPDSKELVVFDAFHHEVHWGHIDLILGCHAPAQVWPVLDRWLAERSR